MLRNTSLALRARTQVQYRARLEGHVQSWLGLLYTIPGFEEDDDYYDDDGELILERWERDLRRYSMKSADSTESLRRSSLMRKKHSPRKKKMRRWGTNRNHHGRKFKMISGNLNKLETSLENFERTIVIPDDPFTLIHDDDDDEEENDEEKSEKVEEDSLLVDNANVVAVTVDDVDDRKLLVFARRPQGLKSPLKRVNSEEGAVAITAPESPISTSDSGTPRVEDDLEDLELSRATDDMMFLDMFAGEGSSSIKSHESSFTSENMNEEESTDDISNVVGAFNDFYGDVAARTVIDASRNALRPEIDESDDGEWICFVYLASSSESCKQLRTRVRRYISSDPTVRLIHARLYFFFKS